MSVRSCGKNDARILYNDKLSKYVELGDYKNIPVDTKSDTFKEFYDEVISSDIYSNDLYVQKTEGEVADGDTVNIDYEGKKDGVAFDGSGADDLFRGGFGGADSRIGLRNRIWSEKNT